MVMAMDIQPVRGRFPPTDTRSTRIAPSRVYRELETETIRVRGGSDVTISTTVTNMCSIFPPDRRSLCISCRSGESRSI